MPVRVSVCMATYNGGQFIGRQLSSILQQLSSTDEIVISDDSSTDDTLEVIESFVDSRIRLFKSQTFHSPVYNFEHALRHARGEVIFLSDQDDEWNPGWVQAALDVLRYVSLVVCDADVIDADGNFLPREMVSMHIGSRRPGVLRNLYRNSYIGCCCAFRREVLDKALPFPAELPWHDWWIGLIADAFYATRFIETRFVRYRRHGGNVSPTSQGSTAKLGRKCYMRWIIGNALVRSAIDLRRH